MHISLKRGIGEKALNHKHKNPEMSWDDMAELYNMNSKQVFGRVIAAYNKLTQSEKERYSNIFPRRKVTNELLLDR